MKTDTPSINVGKQGVTDSLVDEIRTQLTKHGRIKVRILRSARTRERGIIAEEVSRKTDSLLEEFRGYTFLLTKKRFK